MCGHANCARIPATLCLFAPASEMSPCVSVFRQQKGVYVKLSELSSSDLGSLLKARAPAVFENEAGMFPVQVATAAVLGHALSQPFEVRPSGLNAALLAELLFSNADGLRDRWIRVVAMVYWSGGRGFYQQSSAGSFTASIQY